jgi:Tol biopolymer transport system component
MITGSGKTVLRVVRVDDGQLVDFEIAVSGAQAPNGRTRWMPDGSAIAFNWNDQSHVGVYVQQFRPGSDTSDARKLLVNLDRSGIAETFGISPDGKQIAVAASIRIFSLMSAENVADLQPPRAGG